MNLLPMSMWKWPKKCCRGWVCAYLGYEISCGYGTHFSCELRVSTILWLVFIGYQMLMSLFFLSDSKKTNPSNLKGYT